MTKQSKLMAGLVVVLGVALLLETGYLIGLKKSPVESQAQSGLNKSYKPKYGASFHSTPKTNQSQRFVADPFFRSRLDDWDPFEEMARMQDHMNRAFSNSFGKAQRFGFLDSTSGGFYQPHLDMKETDKAYIVKLDMPGIEKDQINIQVHEHSITLSGERKAEKEETNDSERFYRYERSSGMFSRTIPLPEDASRTGIEAKMDKGVLTIVIPKLTETNQKGAVLVPVEDMPHQKND